MGQYKTCTNFWVSLFFSKEQNDCWTTINKNSTIVPLRFAVWWNAWCFWKNVAMTVMCMWKGHFCLFLLSFHGSGTLIRVLCFCFQSLSLGFSPHPTKNKYIKNPQVLQLSHSSPAMFGTGCFFFLFQGLSFLPFFFYPLVFHRSTVLSLSCIK